VRITKQNSVVLSGKEALEFIEQAICDGIQTNSFSRISPKNLFGRPVTFNASPDFAFATGFASTGLRVSAIMPVNKLATNIHQLRMANRQFIPVVIHAIQTTEPPGYEQTALPGTTQGVFQIFPANVQEILDFSLISHRISELALVPGINQISLPPGNQVQEEISVPAKEEIIKFIGSPDDYISPPTPAQNMIFGKQRRRIPDWFSLDNPVQTGQDKDPIATSLEYAARNEYFYAHLPEIIDQVFDEYATLTGRRYTPLDTFHARETPNLIITAGNEFKTIASHVEALKKNKPHTGYLNIRLLNPFPEKYLIEILRNKKVVTVLEPVHDTQMPLYRHIREVINGNKNMPVIYSGLYRAHPAKQDIYEVILNMGARNPKGRYYLGVEFTRPDTEFPKHQVLLQRISREYPDLQERSMPVAKSPDKAAGNKPHVTRPVLPVSVRHYKDKGPQYSQLARFYDNTALFYVNDSKEELVADPFQAVPAVPPVTASFAGYSHARDHIPTFLPQNCTACGKCYVACPHSAIPPVAINIEQLIKAGIDIASANGTPVIGLIPMVKNLVKMAAKILKEADRRIENVADFLDEAFDKLVVRIKPEGEKLKALQTEFRALMDAIAGLPVAVTEGLYNEPEAQETGQGHLFALAIDSHACTGCGICTVVCQDEALEMVDVSADTMATVDNHMRLWEALPDTPADIINRLLHNKSGDPFAALLLSRNFYMTMTGGSQSEQGAPQKQLIHLISAIAESTGQPRYARLAADIEGFIGKLSENIHAALSEALPKENFESLQQAINEAGQRKIPFDELISNISHEEHLKQLDSVKINRKITLLNALRELLGYINEGPTGTGRARFGISMSLEDAGSWASTYPYNVFTSPVFMATPEVAHGLITGQQQKALSSIRLLRKAQLEVKNKYIPSEHDKEIASLTWESITDEEKTLIPPVLVFGDQTLLQNHWSALVSLLSSGKPVKVFILDGMSAHDGAEEDITAGNAAILSLMLLKNSYVFQGSLSDHAVLFNGIAEGIQSTSPALFRVYAPGTEQHDIPGRLWPELCHLAANTRAFPFIKFNPVNYDGLLNSAIQLDANPSYQEDWHSQTLDYTQNEENTLQFQLTWADWAYTLTSWKAHFRPWEEKDGKPVQISEFLKLEQGKSNDHAPVIIRIKDNKLLQFVVSDQVIKMTRTVQASWRMLRELGGTLTKFPVKLKKTVEAELKSQHEKELEELKKDFDRRIKTMEKEQIELIRKKLRDKLVELTNKGAT